MTYDDLREMIDRQLKSPGAPPNATTTPGGVMYSGLNTITPGQFYIMGFNPAGDKSNKSNEINSPPAINPEKFIINNICNPRGMDEKNDYSAYTMDYWKTSPQRPVDSAGRLHPNDRKRHQRQVVELCQLVYGVSVAEADTVTEKTFSANAIWAEEARIENINNLQQWWSICWPLHQYLLSIIRPNCIIALGYGFNWNTSAFALLLAKMGKSNINGFENIVQNNQICGRHFRGDLSLMGPLTGHLAGPDKDRLHVNVLGIRHPSRPSNIGGLAPWLEKNASGWRRLSGPEIRTG
jgi:hypothetical protein